jgi:hypothetical protein
MSLFARFAGLFAKQDRMLSAAVYLRSGTYFIVTIHGCDGGAPCISAGPVDVRPVASSHEELGNAIVSGLKRSTHGVGQRHRQRTQTKHARFPVPGQQGAVGAGHRTAALRSRLPIVGRIRQGRQLLARRPVRAATPGLAISPSEGLVRAHRRARAENRNAVGARTRPARRQRTRTRCWTRHRLIGTRSGDSVVRIRHAVAS